jgi:hypothetical protein
MKNKLGLLFAGMFLATTGSALAATHYVWQGSPGPAPPYTNWVTAATNIQDAVDTATSGDTVLVTNGVYAVGERDWSRVTITNSIRLESVNGPLATAIDGGGSRRCVYLGSNAILSGFTLTNGRAARQEAFVGGGVCCESTNAVLSSCVLTGNVSSIGGGAHGGTLNNCTLSGNWALEGGGAENCTLNNCIVSSNSVFQDSMLGVINGGGGGGADNCTLNNCMLTGNSACTGGGAAGCTLNNCTLTGNSALGGWDEEGYPSRAFGGGAYGCTLYNCTLTGNSANAFYDFDGNYLDGVGGGASGCILYNCTLTGNLAAGNGAGVSIGFNGTPSTLYNCILYFNTATNGANYDSSSTLNYCCTTPLPTNGLGNITNAPLFVNFAAGDYRLRPDSPCIDAGTNLAGLISTDILGLPRLMDGNDDGMARVDMGAYEFNPYRFAPTLHLSASGFQFTVYGEPNRSVRIERSRDLVNWEHFATVPIPASGQTLIDPVATSEPRLFYRAMRVP